MADFRELARQYMSSENADEIDQIISGTAAGMSQSRTTSDSCADYVQQYISPLQIAMLCEDGLSLSGHGYGSKTMKTLIL
jgi:hypothetical protein